MRIGPFLFQQWRGTMARPYRPKIRLPARAGVQNNVIMRGYLRTDISNISTAVIVNSLFNAHQLVDGYLGLASAANSVTATDQHGVNFSSVIVMSVDFEISVALNNFARVDARWRLDVGL